MPSPDAIKLAVARNGNITNAAGNSPSPRIVRLHLSDRQRNTGNHVTALSRGRNMANSLRRIRHLLAGHAHTLTAMLLRRIRETQIRWLWNIPGGAAYRYVVFASKRSP